jgi:ribosomal-protein-alanine N-acetyltransferase
MLTRFLSAACEKTGGTVTLEVAIDNHAAIALYEKHGFGTVGKRANYYQRDGYRCDALVMQFDAASPFS